MCQDEVNRPLRVCYFGTYRANYSRNQIMIEGLRRNGVEVIECHESLWRGIEDRVQAASGGWLRPAFIARVVRTYWRLLRAYHKIGDYDVMMLGYPGQLDVYLARILTWLRRKPLVLDVFMSLYLIASERGLTARHSITGRLIYWMEKLALRLPDLLIQDTAEYVEWFQEIYGLDAARFRLVPTGADDRIFRPIEVDNHDDSLFRVLYYGTFIPNHGVEYIIEAARILQDEPDIRFELIGDGPMKAQAVALAKEYGLTNVSFVDWVDKHALPRKVAEADVCLGVFGTTPQSMMTVQNKIYEGLAMGKPVITGEGPAVRRALVHGEHLYLCERANPRALADAVCALKVKPDLRQCLAESGYHLYHARFNLQHNGARFAAYLHELVECYRSQERHL
jgi:glycosyltransferase involved in cell wall biosynthesis